MTASAATEPTVPTRDQVLRAPKVLLHDHLDGGLRPATIVELAAEIGHELPADDAEALGALVRRGGRLRLAGALPRDLRPHRRGDAERRRRSPGWPASAWRTWPPTASCTPRSATPPSSTSSQGLTLDEVVAAVQEGFDEGDGGGRRPDRRAPAADRDAPPGPLDGDRRAGGRLARPRRGRLRHRRRRGRLPAHPAPRRVRVPPARERPLHHPRRRGVRAAVDLAGDPVVRRRPARPRRADHRRHHRRRRTAAVELGRLAAYVRDKRIPLEMCPSSNVQTGAAASIAEHPIGLLDQAAVPGHGQHRQPADERDLDDRRDVVAGRGVRLRRWTTCGGSRSTR